MYCIITIVRYPAWFGWAGFLSMALFRLPLWLNKQFSFYKLLGCGKNGTFDIRPDWRQWAVLTVGKEKSPAGCRHVYGPLIYNWWRLFKCTASTIVLEPIEGHGTWDGKACFGILPRQTGYDGRIAVLTRATIRLSRLRNFWKHVDAVAGRMRKAEGFITSAGIGEAPWIRQATLSIWQNKTAMKNFAYQIQEHAEVVRKTKKENWYSEEMFVRFKIVSGNMDEFVLL
ncbi:DUF3291 domain-containing protein [Foetidibacter luteolus]|uniref:DUF3291 domain-containing protein n=1 Tax=Foetidibacter luteolus TaxID=2608880 RepID=UPI00129A4357|nr:DUF3291 domain-containing protein [Foetidibacter luteolus]